MSRRDPELTLRQIVEFADEVAALVARHPAADLSTNREFRRALERCVELIGEAATRLPEESRAEHPEIPWRQIIAMRNVLIHGYDQVADESCGMSRREMFCTCGRLLVAPARANPQSAESGTS